MIGKDTRLSGYMIEPALVAGFIGAGMDVVLVGPLPTPAIAMLTRSLRADLGVMISASHNPFEDNGIKLFGPDGFKLSDATEAEIEALMGSRPLGRSSRPRQRSAAPRRLEDAAGRYIEAAKATFPRGLRLDGLQDRRRLRQRRRLPRGADGAVGARRRGHPGRRLARRLQHQPRLRLDRAGPSLRRRCVEHGADLGIALDGDADRLILADEHGEIIDGDQILALIARSWAKTGRLTGGGVVATVMSNLGLERFLRGRGLDLHRTQVGDRYVVERMRARGINLGGEQSGPCHPVRFRHHRRRAGRGAAGAGGAGAAGRAGQRGLPGVRSRCRSCCGTSASPAPRRLHDPRVKAAIAEAEAALEPAGPAADPRERHRAADPRHGRGRG